MRLGREQPDRGSGHLLMGRARANLGLMLLVGLTMGVASCGSHDSGSVEARLGRHDLLTSQLPDDATRLNGPYCQVASPVDSAACTVIYATAMSLQNIQDHYRGIYDARGWESLIDNEQYSESIWLMEWRDETYKVVIRIREPEQWHGAAGPPGTQFVIDAMVVERE